MTHSSKTKLELTWIGKDQRPRLEPRILLEDPALSYHAEHRVTDADLFDSRVIFGDNLLALKALEQEFTGKIKCIYIDPPYNTGSAFANYDDGIEHSLWLTLFRDRLEILKKLLSDDGVLWITLDDNEVFYAKVLADEVFGRANFISSIAWNSRKSKQNDTDISLGHNFLLLYSKNRQYFKLNRMPTTEAKFANPDNDPKGPWVADPFDAPNIRPNLTYAIKNPNTGVESLRVSFPGACTVTGFGILGSFRSRDSGGSALRPHLPVDTPQLAAMSFHYWPPTGRCWRTTPKEFDRYNTAGMIVFGKTGKSKPQLKRYLSDASDKGETPGTWWDDTGTATEGTQEIQSLFGSKTFDTPKPERLIERVLLLSTKGNDWVLDSFAGSGTTGAVAHKMGRRFVMIELGEHAHTHILPRLKKVVDGTDQGGISQAVGWQGGGGFRYFKLAPSLLEKDKWGQWVINKAYNPAMLAEAVCKHEGFTYCPSDTEYWNQGYSSEQDHIYVTTQTLTQERLAQISEDVGDGRTLKVCCAAFRGRADAFANLSITKIPNAIATRCEWGRDDYSLQIAALPAAPLSEPVPAPRKNGSANASVPSLFDAVIAEGEEVR